MPIYEYACRRCEVKFEILHRSSEERKPVCPKCGAEEISRLFSVFGFSSGGNFVASTSKDQGCSTCRSKDCSSCG
jgi:putative FmdB family regulatory protein